MADDKLWFKYRHAQASNAWQIASAIAASVPIAEITSEGEHRMTPRQIASFACDIAAAMKEELVAREWVELIDRPPV